MKTRRETRNTAQQRYRQPSASATYPSARPTAPREGKINFRIERLTLEGYTRADQTRFTRAFERSLRELASHARGVDWAAATGADRINAGTLLPGATPEQAARHTARQIVLSLRHERRQIKETAHA